MVIEIGEFVSNKNKVCNSLWFCAKCLQTSNEEQRK